MSYFVCYELFNMYLKVWVILMVKYEGFGGVATVNLKASRITESCYPVSKGRQEDMFMPELLSAFK